MAAKKPNRLERFIILFDALKKATKNDPEKLKIFYDQSDEVKNAADAIRTFVISGDFKRRVFHGDKKYFPQAPVGFDRAWNDYNLRWEGPLIDCWIDIDLSLYFPEIEEKNDARVAPPPEIELESPDLESDTEYDPINHDGGKAFQMAFWITESYADEVGTEFEDDIHVASKIGLSAYDYLENTIGLDASEVFRRWRQVPVVFMPTHVSNKHGLTERGSIYELIDDAVRAYVFGAPAAAIAMCRTVLEMILKQHYNLSYQYKDNKGRWRDKGLGSLIIMANERYNFIHGSRIKILTDKANTIMHKYSDRKAISRADEKIIIDFFKTNKFLLERAPKK